MPDLGLYPPNGAMPFSGVRNEDDPATLASATGTTFTSPAGEYKPASAKSSTTLNDNGWVATADANTQIEIAHGSLWVGCSIPTATCNLTKEASPQIGQSAVACVELVPGGTSGANIGPAFSDASGQSVGVRLQTVNAGGNNSFHIQHFKFISSVFTTFLDISVAGFGRVWLAEQYTGANSFRAYISMNGSLWVPLQAAQSATITPTRLGYQAKIDSGANGAAVFAFHAVDLTTLI